MTPEEIKQEIEKAVSYQKYMMESDENGQAMPHAFFNGKGGYTCVAVDPVMMSDWRQKIVIALQLARLVFINEAEIITFMSDGFGSQIPMTDAQLAQRPESPNDWKPEERQEAILVFVSIMGTKGKMLLVPYQRVDGNLVWSEMQDITENTSARFCLDLTERNAEKTLEKIIAFGDGRQHRGMSRTQ